jgi:hypothetical protein
MTSTNLPSYVALPTEEEVLDPGHEEQILPLAPVTIVEEIVLPMQDITFGSYDALDSSDVEEGLTQLGTSKLNTVTFSSSLAAYFSNAKELTHDSEDPVIVTEEPFSDEDDVLPPNLYKTTTSSSGKSIERSLVDQVGGLTSVAAASYDFKQSLRQYYRPLVGLAAKVVGFCGCCFNPIPLFSRFVEDVQLTVIDQTFDNVTQVQDESRYSEAREQRAMAVEQHVVSDVTTDLVQITDDHGLDTGHQQVRHLERYHEEPAFISLADELQVFWRPSIGGFKSEDLDSLYLWSMEWLSKRKTAVRHRKTVALAALLRASAGGEYQNLFIDFVAKMRAIESLKKTPLL